ncbi:hypothetical protein P3X46_017243 [Hevea brasiliensis]|uniref:Uncharacterized protein n=1 Tax=Hevea brasiliensis TaxID=3981 RepID=A0ABQ9M5K2_HEVBR|nr:hypothetical protein P3X46_017243 [Hevea brasiliensis]
MSRHSCLFILLLFLPLIFFVSSAARLPNPTSFFNSFPRNHQHFNPQPLSCDSFSHKSTSRSLCIHFQRMNPQRRLVPPPPPPSPASEEIDPRYGAEKRLVPSGPNPLHN